MKQEHRDSPILITVTDKEINAYPHREMFGALGAALDVIKSIKDLEKQNKKYTRITKQEPIKPVSSATIENIKSVCCIGK